MQTVLLKFMPTKMTLKQEYTDFIKSITLAEENDYRLLRRSLEEFVHTMGGKYRKITLDDLRTDLTIVKRDGKLP